ncbi:MULTISPECIES: 4Fe-4S dicluster domain-containing protein [Metallosphaera]|uniref:4Fe-4S dicluster domain-containing protein n=1 Tax=Metallosphaera TaxID=41980 RepID=UPI001F0688B6|nr:4Fe-4S dicluster domain-containing protein [Metallosphaera sedula]MCH1771610.1 4Fe-4S dicluster domain-containing protein [Metallosphaera sedula]MCP6728209.1 4Fe-4S dicluster domain-containing protein [Metallosphaera sedula]
MILDASIFSRAIAIMGIESIKKQMVTEEKEVIIGRGTSMSGSILQYLNPKVTIAPSRFEDGSVYRVVENKGTFSKLDVPSGITFKELLDRLSRDNLYPALFPMYLTGTVGGFVATNGSGFGSYKFGFVNYKKIVHEFKDKFTVSLLTVNYGELVETSEESKFSWTGIFRDGKEVYYVPSIYSGLLEKKNGSIDTSSLIKEISSSMEKLLGNNKIPICVRSDKLVEMPQVEWGPGYIINYNSPSRQVVRCGSISKDDMDELFSFLKKNPTVLPFPNLQSYSEIQKIILNKFDKDVKIPKYANPIKAEYLEALKCVNCGQCLDSCLAYRTTQDYSRSPPGKFSRLFTGETNFEACFGCMECQEACPVGVNISSVTEVLPKLKEKKTVTPVDTPQVSFKIREMERIVEGKYKNKPPVMLFAGCAAKYDMQGIEGFLQFLLDYGEELNTYSPRVKIMDGSCCGFDKLIAGDVEGAKADVMKIKELKEKQGLKGVYFLCPEALYVYNKLSGEQGVLAYDLLKDKVNGTIHAGCWARKLGYSGEDKECAGSYFTTYHGKLVQIKNKKVLTICPFSTWKFNTVSVYGSFAKPDSTRKSAEETNMEVNEDEIIDVFRDALKNAILMSADDVADRANSWSLGGKSYFVLLSVPVIRKKFTNILIQRLGRNTELKNYFSKLVNNQISLDEKSSRWSEIVNGMNFDELADELIKRVANSGKLEYESRNLINKPEFRSAILDDVLKKIVTPAVVQDIIKNIAYM